MPKGVYPHTHIKPKVYPDELVEQVCRLYVDEGRTIAEVASTLGRTPKVIYRLMANHGIPRRIAAKRNQSGTNNHMWRGISAGYQALHLRVDAARGKPPRCSACETTDPFAHYEWANLTGDYANVIDYIRLCIPCHRRFDGYRRAVTGERTSPKRRSA